VKINLRKKLGRELQFVLSVLVMLGSHSARAQNLVRQLPADDQQTIAAQLGPGVLGKALPSKPIDDVSIYFPLRDTASIYQVVAGPNAGKAQMLDLAKVTRPDGRVAWRFQLSPTLASFIRPTPEGDLMMPAISDMGQGVVVITTPANPFILKGIKPGESRSYVQRVLVNELDDPSDRKYSGSLKGTFTYLGTYLVTVPAGIYGAVLLRLKCDGNVGPAATHDIAYYFFAPGKGVVAMIAQENATAFWLIQIDTKSGKVLKKLMASQ
jgi:hypothetical protein